ncbi:glycosyltransferase family 2 protein [Pedobacter agri]|uniref:glycosyltransferase family 2 protein n=1 Tax=Pedobacter agri TaxID=454586 RepID=UPI000299F74C|nr:glycosyltransferase family 2 protein [Pedobacter agri]
MILSVIIPCYNHGQYVQEAIDSVLTYQDQPVEIIIIDDGSTDEFTISKIEELKQEGFKVIQHPNAGLAFSRNVGISAAQGKYILPLDADNKIKADYIRKALPVLENNEADIVYSRPIFFGDVTPDRIFSSREFDAVSLLYGNYIDACAIYRKDVWHKNIGYDEQMPYQGLEDWDFWLNSYFNDFSFRFIEQELYYYRILKNSMITKIVNDNSSEDYIFLKYKNQIIRMLQKLKSYELFFENDQKNYLRTSLKYFIRFFKKKWFP